MPELTKQQRSFAEAYVCNPALNGAEAAKIAGYGSPRHRACELLQMPHVKEYIAQLQAERSERVAIDADYVIERLKKEAELYADGASHSARVSALGLLGKHLGMFTEKHEITGADGKDLFPQIQISYVEKNE